MDIKKEEKNFHRENRRIVPDRRKDWGVFVYYLSGGSEGRSYNERRNPKDQKNDMQTIPDYC